MISDIAVWQTRNTLNIVILILVELVLGLTHKYFQILQKVSCCVWIVKRKLWKKLYDHWPLKHVHGQIVLGIIHPDINIKNSRPHRYFRINLHNGGGLLWGAWQDANNSWWPEYLRGIFYRSKEFNRGRCKVSTGSGNFDDYRKLTDMKTFLIWYSPKIQISNRITNHLFMSLTSHL